MFLINNFSGKRKVSYLCKIRRINAHPKMLKIDASWNMNGFYRDSKINPLIVYKSQSY